MLYIQYMKREGRKLGAVACYDKVKEAALGHGEPMICGSASHRSWPRCCLRLPHTVQLVQVGRSVCLTERLNEYLASSKSYLADGFSGSYSLRPHVLQT